jgi:hypothetical protein
MRGEMHREYGTTDSSVLYTASPEREASEIAIAAGTTNYKAEDVIYYFNDHGFRGTEKIGDNSSPSVGTFGCSFTFGIGLPADDTYPMLFGKHLGSRVYNFGVPGGSMNKATRYYSLASQYQHFDHVIFLIPHIGRMEIPREYKNVPYGTNLIPNWKFTSPIDEAMRRRTYTVFDNMFLEYDTLRNISHCINIARANNTKIYFSSWDPTTFEVLRRYLGDDTNMIIPYFQTIEFSRPVRINMARDGFHPGAESQLQFLNKAIPYLK